VKKRPFDRHFLMFYAWMMATGGIWFWSIAEGANAGLGAMIFAATTFFGFLFFSFLQDRQRWREQNDKEQT
tara:strand:+ start:812 stop:1024 length:213 start_codon:yes stop_codon:yes gene_type:complete